MVNRDDTVYHMFSKTVSKLRQYLIVLIIITKEVNENMVSRFLLLLSPMTVMNALIYCQN